MKSLPYWFIGLATLFALAGMGFGLYMEQVNDYTLAPAHAHNNLIGWVGMAIYGLYYKAVPAAALTRVAVVHFWVALAGSLTFGVGIGMAILGNPVVIIIASPLVILAMLLFAYIVWTNRAGLSVD